MKGSKKKQAGKSFPGTMMNSDGTVHQSAAHHHVIGTDADSLNTAQQNLVHSFLESFIKGEFQMMNITM